MLFWLYVCPSQLLCLHDLLPCMCLTGAGGKMVVAMMWMVYVCLCVLVDAVLMCLNVFHVCQAVQRESRGPSYLAAEPLLQSDGGRGGQQT